MGADANRTAVIIKSKTRYEQLVSRFNTREQAKFYITQNQLAFQARPGQAAKPAVKQGPAAARPNAARAKTAPAGDFSDYETEHRQFHAALAKVTEEVSRRVKTKTIEREFLPQYIFTPEDIAVVVGQDGLVANAAKYVKGIPIVGVNPLPDRFDGILLPFTAESAGGAVERVLAEGGRTVSVTMAEALLNDGQRLLAFNDLFIGINDHSSARYTISLDGKTENHSSSGVIVSTGAGSTGWLSSLVNMANGMNRFFAGREAIEKMRLPWDARELVFVVREPFASKSSQIGITAGKITGGRELVLESLMPTKGVIFSDGVQADFLQFNSGAIARIRVAEERARLVLP